MENDGANPIMPTTPTTVVLQSAALVPTPTVQKLTSKALAKMKME